MGAALDDRSDELGSAVLVDGAAVDCVPDGAECGELGEAGVVVGKPLWRVVEFDGRDTELVVESGVGDDNAELHVAECCIRLVLIVTGAALE